MEGRCSGDERQPRLGYSDLVIGVHLRAKILLADAGVSLRAFYDVTGPHIAKTDDHFLNGVRESFEANRRAYRRFRKTPGSIGWALEMAS